MNNEGDHPSSGSFDSTERRDRVEEAFALTPAFVAMVRGPDHVFEMVNPRYRELIFDREVIGRPIRDALPEIDSQGFPELLDRVYQTGEPYVGREQRVLLQPAPGEPTEERYLDFVYQPLHDRAGEPTGVLVHGYDVTDTVVARQRAEEATVEMEAQADELQSQAAQLEEVQAELEIANEDLQHLNDELTARTDDAEREREAAHDLSARLEAVLQQMPSGVAVVEAPSGKVMLVNDQFARTWRLDPDEARDRHLDPGRAFHLDGSPYQADERPLVRSLATGETIIDEEMEIIRGDDSRGVLSVRSAPVRNAAGEIVAAIAITDDISEWKEHERQREFLMEAGQTLATSIDYRNTLEVIARLAVPTLADWCAVDVLEDGVVQRLAVVHQDPSKEELAREATRRWPTDPDSPTGIARVLRTGEPELYPDIPRDSLGADGNDPEYTAILQKLDLRSAMLVPMVARDSVVGAITFIGAESGRRFDEADLVFARQLASRAAIAVDNARLFREAGLAREQAEDARQQAEEARADAELANRAKSEFLAAMSHELRTPLNAIGGYADLLLLGIRGELNPEQREDITRIRRSGEHLLTLINDILNFAKLEAGQVQFKIEEVTIEEILLDLEDVVELQVAATGLSYSAEQCDRQLVVRADREKTRQILLNLVTNSIKHTERGGQIAILCDATDRTVRISVRDSGSGIAADQLDRIFDPFVQLDRHLGSSDHHGVGLGLGISRDLAEGMHGRLSVESAVGEGSTFTLTLPRGAPRAI